MAIGRRIPVLDSGIAGFLDVHQDRVSANLREPLQPDPQIHHVRTSLSVDGSELSVRAMDASLELALKLGARDRLRLRPDIPLSAVNASPTTFARKIEA